MNTQANEKDNARVIDTSWLATPGRFPGDEDEYMAWKFRVRQALARWPIVSLAGLREAGAPLDLIKAVAESQGCQISKLIVARVGGAVQSGKRLIFTRARIPSGWRPTDMYRAWFKSTAP